MKFESSLGCCSNLLISLINSLGFDVVFLDQVSLSSRLVMLIYDCSWHIWSCLFGCLGCYICAVCFPYIRLVISSKLAHVRDKQAFKTSLTSLCWCDHGEIYFGTENKQFSWIFRHEKLQY